MRITKKDLQAMFNRFVKASGNDPEKIRLDHIACYGGYMVERDYPGGGCENPYGSYRMSAKEMYRALYFACNVLEEKKREYETD